ncbi:MAG: hypothetical protein EOO25_17375 [Comamonadaceae bacterium]|nr:MAG: hypothetical protein EOO25_17375 [Comamonadaceae bacterium]
MDLHYLLFDFSDEASGSGSFDAIAAVAPQRLPALLAEVSAVLRWAHALWGPAGADGDGGGWDFDLQAVAEPDQALEVSIVDGEVSVAPACGTAITTVTLTMGGPPAFCEAFRRHFRMED